MRHHDGGTRRRREHLLGLQPYVFSQQCFTSFGDPTEQQLREANDGSNNVWRYAYTVAGKLSTVTTPLDVGNRTLHYDQRQFLTSQTTGESGTTGYSHDAIGQVSRRIDARGVQTDYARNDGLGRLTGLNYGTQDDVTFAYDEANNVTDLSSVRGGAYHYVFDELNRVQSQQWQYRGQTYATNYHFDSKGCLDSITYPTGTVLALTCDALNRTKSISVVGSPGYPVVTGVTYHPSGQVESITYGNGIDAQATYDDRSRTRSLTFGTFMAQTYRYDGADNVVYYEDTKNSGSARWMGYDAVDRLVDVASPGLWGDWGYQYDELGNRRIKARLPAAGSYEAVDYQYDGHNRLTESTGPEPVHPISLNWDQAGRLSRTTNTLTGVATTYVYDGHGRRVEKAEPAETTVYHHDAAGRVIAETGSDGAKRRDYFYLGNKLIAVDSCATGNSPTCAEWYHTDALGSVAARSNAAGTVVAKLDYQPFGEQWLVQGDGGDRQYNGRVFDPGTGFHDYGARMYWPQIGRFISADSVMGHPESPMSLNRYSYVLNNPYKYVDPDGKTPLIVAALAVGAAGGVGAAIASYLDHGSVDWGYVRNWTATGFVIGLTGGLSLAASGGSAASTIASTGRAIAAPAVPRLVDAASKMEDARRQLQMEQAHLSNVLSELQAQLENGRKLAERLARDGRSVNPHGLGRELEELPRQIEQVQTRLQEIAPQLVEAAKK